MALRLYQLIEKAKLTKRVEVIIGGGDRRFLGSKLTSAEPSCPCSPFRLTVTACGRPGSVILTTHAIRTTLERSSPARTPATSSPSRTTAWRFSAS